MKFKYIGDKESISLFGYDFPQDVGVEVSCDHAIGKLSNNSHFESVKEAEKKPSPKKSTTKKKAKAED